MDILLPKHELAFYAIVFFWVMLRYHYFRKHQENRLEDRDIIIPGFPRFNAVLVRYNPYYATLTHSAKQRFISRLNEVLANIEIQGRDGFEVTEEVKIQIGGCITQLTFGFDQPVIPFLKGVVVYPSIFYSRLADAWVKGLAIGNGVVFISWDDFTEGYKYSTSTYNLGLHEFAHILKMQSDELGNFDARLNYYFDVWEKNNLDVFQNIKRGEKSFFREYGGTNKAEFFSVCIENFFEVPDQVEKELPELYWHLCYLLNQNPLNVKGDFSFDSKQILEANSELSRKIPLFDIYNSNLEYSFWYWINKLIVLLLGAIIVSVVYLSGHDELFSVMRMTLVSSIIVFTIRVSYYQNLKSILETAYSKHFLLNILPLTWLTALLFNWIMQN